MCAEQAGHDGARAWVRATQAKLAYWDGRFTESAQLDENGLLYAASDSARVFLALFMARALARSGRREDASSALAKADAERDRVSEPDMPGGVWELTPGRYHGLSAGVWLLLNDADRAVAEAVQAIALNSAAPAGERHLYATACAAVGLDSTGAEVLYGRANTVCELTRLPVVVRLRYTRGDAVWTQRLAASVHATAWLHEKGFACVWPLEVEHPVAANGYLATFWHYVPTVRQPLEDVQTLGRLLRELHGLGMPPVELPEASPLSSLREETKQYTWLPDPQRSWVLGRYEELSRRHADTTWVLGQGMIHGDAWAENLIHGRDRVVLADWDSVSYGPREQDIVPTLIRHRFGRPTAEWEQFCQAYEVDPAELPGLSVLKEMRELRTLVPHLRSTGLPQVKAEVTRRIGDLMSGTQSDPWHALNLAS